MWISCRIRSDSHTLTGSAFRLLQLTESNIRIKDVSERDFVISVRALVESAPESVQLHNCHHIINAMLIALNVATIGSFFWQNDPWIHPLFTVAEDYEGKNCHESALIVRSNTEHEQLETIEERHIHDAILIFGIIAREESKILIGEYCRGLLLLRMNFCDINFRREAFLCFYRALEYFVAVRILGVKRLKNELRDLQRGLEEIGASRELLEELRALYVIRSSQVAHSQMEQRELSFDEVLKIKVFLDFVMHKTFKHQAYA